MKSPNEIDNSKIMCNLQFLEDDQEECFFSLAEKTNRLKSRSDYVRRVSNVSTELEGGYDSSNASPLPRECLLARLHCPIKK
jgi:hypothetical protein